MQFYEMKRSAADASVYEHKSQTSDKVKRSAGSITIVTAAVLYLDSVYALSTHQDT